ncbi:MAG: LLM class flavin-dependent oxidoreductase [Dehalococcoidia bacterium]
MEYGIHLPTRSLDGGVPSLDYLTSFVAEADRLGYTYLAINDHFGSGRSLLDPTTALAAVASASGRLRLVTSVMLIVLRGIVPSAKYLAALDVLTGGRVIAGIGPGSQDEEYDIVGLNYKERWPRFDEAAIALRSLLDPEGAPFKGSYYSTEGITFEPRPIQQPSLPIWIGSWGSDAGLRRVARLADGWLGSALDSTPERFKQAKQRLDAFLEQQGKEPTSFPNAVSTMTLYISESQAELDRVPRGTVHPDEPDEAPHQRDMVGSSAECIEKLHRWKDSGAQALFLRPFDDGLNQMRLFVEQVASRD